MNHQEPTYYGAVDLTGEGSAAGPGAGVLRVKVGARGHVIKTGLRAFVPGFDVKVASLQHFVEHGGE